MNRLGTRVNERVIIGTLGPQMNPKGRDTTLGYSAELWIGLNCCSAGDNHES